MAVRSGMNSIAQVISEARKSYETLGNIYFGTISDTFSGSRPSNLSDDPRFPTATHFVFGINQWGSKQRKVAE